MRLAVALALTTFLLGCCGHRGSPPVRPTPTPVRSLGEAPDGGYIPAWGAMENATHLSGAERKDAIARAKQLAEENPDSMNAVEWRVFRDKIRDMEESDARQEAYRRSAAAKKPPRALANLARKLEEAEKKGDVDPTYIRSQCKIELNVYRKHNDGIPEHDALAKELEERCAAFEGKEGAYCDAKVDGLLRSGMVVAAVNMASRNTCSIETVRRAVEAALAAPASLGCRRVEELQPVAMIAGRAGLTERVSAERAKAQPACETFLREHARTVAKKPWALAMVQKVARDLVPGFDLGVPASPRRLEPLQPIWVDLRLPLAWPSCLGNRPITSPSRGGTPYNVQVTCTMEEDKGGSSTVETAHSTIKTKVVYLERADGTTEKQVTTSPGTVTERTTVNMKRFRYRIDASATFVGEMNPNDHFDLVLYSPWSEPTAGGPGATTIHSIESKDVVAAIQKNAEDLARIDRDSRLTNVRRRFGETDPLEREDAAVELLMIDRYDKGAKALLGEIYGLKGPAVTIF